MTDKCKVCDDDAVKGRNYITTSLAGKTTRMDKMRFCKRHGNNLSDYIWERVFQFMRGINIHE